MLRAASSRTHDRPLAEPPGMHCNYAGSVEHGERSLSYVNLAWITCALRITVPHRRGRSD